MGLFSKLFSREGERPTESEGQDETVASPDGEDGVTKSEQTAGAAAGETRTQAAEGEKTEPRTASDKQASSVRNEAVSAAGAATAGKRGLIEPPPAAAAVKGGARKPGDSQKREAAAAVKPPAAVGAAAVVRQRTQTILGMPAEPPAGKTPARVESDASNKAKVAPPPTAAAVKESIRPANEPALPLEAAVDAAMAALLEPSATQANPDLGNDNALDQRALADTFADMAKVHAHPLREFMFQLSVGRTPRQWAASCRPVLRPLFEAASQIGLLELVGALGAFDAALERAAADTGAYVSQAASDALSGCYERLRQQLPDAFSPSEGSDNRRVILLEALLLQIPALQRRTLSKLYAAGVASLAQLSQAKPDELAAVAGIERALAQAVVDHVQRFENERSKLNPAALRSYTQERLREIVLRLTQLQTEFERAEQDDSAERKRAVRKSREAAVLELELLFAEVGALDLIEDLRRCPVRDKIQRVESYLEQLQTSA